MLGWLRALLDWLIRLFTPGPHIHAVVSDPREVPTGGSSRVEVRATGAQPLRYELEASAGRVTPLGGPHFLWEDVAAEHAPRRETRFVDCRGRVGGAD